MSEVGNTKSSKVEGQSDLGVLMGGESVSGHKFAKLRDKLRELLSVGTKNVLG